MKSYLDYEFVHFVNWMIYIYIHILYQCMLNILNLTRFDERGTLEYTREYNTFYSRDNRLLFIFSLIVIKYYYYIISESV